MRIVERMRPWTESDAAQYGRPCVEDGLRRWWRLDEEGERLCVELHDEHTIPAESAESARPAVTAPTLLPGAAKGLSAGTKGEAYRAHRASGHLGKQAQRIAELMADGKGRTRNEIAKDSGISLQATCGRVGELLDSGVLIVHGARPCKVSGVNAQELRAAQPALLAA